MQAAPDSAQLLPGLTSSSGCKSESERRIGAAGAGQGAAERAGCGAGAAEPRAVCSGAAGKDSSCPAHPCAPIRSAGGCWLSGGAGAGAGSQGCPRAQAAVLWGEGWRYPQLPVGDAGMEAGVWLAGIIDAMCIQVRQCQRCDGGVQPCLCTESP